MTLAIRWFLATDAWPLDEYDSDDDDKWPERDDRDDRTCEA